MRTLGESKISSFSLLVQNRGMIGCDESKISLCNPWVVLVLLSSTSDLLRVGCCSLVCLEGLRMIELMVVGFCPTGG